MKELNSVCPFCKAENKRMYLEETDGWFECQKCNSVVRDMRFFENRTFDIKLDLSKIVFASA